MDTQTQIDRLIELAIIQRTELKQLVEQLPQLREHLNAEVEKVFEEAEPQLRSELEDWTTKQAADKTAALGVALEAKIAELSKNLEISTQARYNAIIAEREENARLAAQAEAKIAEHAASLPNAVKEIVTAELARFPRAGEIDQLRKEFAEPRGLNPRGKWQSGETYNRLDLVTYNGDSFVSNIDGNTEKPSRNAANWTLNAARGAYGGGGGITSLNDVLNAPTSGQIIGSQNGQYVPKTLVAGANITINETASAITIIGDEGQISLQDGTAADPSLFFTNDPDTGIYRPAANTLGISTSGVQRMYVDANGITTVGAGATFDGSVHAANGNANNPSFSFTSDQDTGFFRHQPNEIGVALGGTQYATLTSTTFSITPVVTMASSLRVNGTTDSSSKDTGAIVTEGGLGVEKSASIGGNLTVSGGTVDNSPASGGPLFRTIRPANTGSAAFASIPNGALSASNVEWYSGLIGSSGDYKIWAYNGSTNTFAFSSTPAGNVTLAGNLTVSGTDYNYVGGNKFFRGFTNYNVLYTGATELSINNQADGANLASFKNNGNFLIGTNVDSSALLQVGTNTTTAAGGMKFGTDTSLYRSAAYTLKLDGGNNVTSFRVLGSGSCEALMAVASASSVLFGSTTAGASTVLCSGNGTTALTLDSSQNAIFAKDVRVQAATSALTWFKDSTPTKAWGIGSNGWAGLSGGDGSMIFGVYTGSAWSKALELDNATQNATFAGAATVNGTNGVLVNKSGGGLSIITLGDGTSGGYCRLNMRNGPSKYGWCIGAQDITDNALTITPSTAVGGTTFTTPILTLAQSGNATFGGNLTVSGGQALISHSGSYANIYFALTGSAYSEIRAFSSTGEFRTNSGPSAGWGGFLTWQTDASEKMRLTNGGNLLIGTTTDGGQKLQVSGTAAIAGTLTLTTSASSKVILTNTAAAGVTWELNSFSDGDFFITHAGVVNAFQISKTSGNATFAGTIKSTYGSFSSQAYTIGDSSYGLYVASGNLQFKNANSGTFEFKNIAGTSDSLFISPTVVAVGSGAALKLGNAYVAGAPTATGYVTIQDSAGNTYKVLVGT